MIRTGHGENPVGFCAGGNVDKVNVTRVQTRIDKTWNIKVIKRFSECTKVTCPW